MTEVLPTRRDESFPALGSRPAKSEMTGEKGDVNINQFNEKYGPALPSVRFGAKPVNGKVEVLVQGLHNPPDIHGGNIKKHVISIDGNDPAHSQIRGTVTGNIFFRGNLDFLQGNNELTRDYPTWFKILVAANSGVVLNLIYQSASNNPQSISTKIGEAAIILSASVGFCASLAGLHFDTCKPKNLPFGFDPDDLLQNLSAVGGIATALAYIGGISFLLPNSISRWVTVATASASVLIPTLLKLCVWRGAAHT